MCGLLNARIGVTGPGSQRYVNVDFANAARNKQVWRPAIDTLQLRIVCGHPTRMYGYTNVKVIPNIKHQHTALKPHSV